jgi:hypothetical protein
MSPEERREVALLAVRIARIVTGPLGVEDDSLIEDTAVNLCLLGRRALERRFGALASRPTCGWRRHLRPGVRVCDGVAAYRLLLVSGAERHVTLRCYGHGREVASPWEIDRTWRIHG